MPEVREKLDDLQNEENNEEGHEEVETDEEKAGKIGWREDGKNLFGESVSAERYLQERPLYDTITKLKKSLSKVDSRVETLQSDQIQLAKAFDQEKTNLLQQLKDQREEALDIADTDEVRKLNKKIEATEKVQQQVSTKKDITKSMIKFVKANPWYDINPGKKIIADGIWDDYVGENPNATPDQALDYVVGEMKKEFPELYEEKEQDTAPSKVSSSTRRVTGKSVKKKTPTIGDIKDPEERRAVENIAARLGKSVDEYMKNYKLAED